MSDARLGRVRPDQLSERLRLPVTAEILEQSAGIVEDVRERGEEALRDHSLRLGDLSAHDDPLVYTGDDLKRCVDSIDVATRLLLEKTSARIRKFAEAQMAALTSIDVPVEGGRAGHRILPVGTVGAYAPGGRHPLPSSVLMSVLPAVTAGVGEVWVASPRPTPATIAAAAMAGAHGLIGVGGAQAIASLAFGTISPQVDLVVGPGNAWVTGAKKHLYGEVGIDGLAGPSEIVVVADESSNPAFVAADLLAQAEHDPAALPVLVTTTSSLVDRVNEEIQRQLVGLPTAKVAAQSIESGFAVVVSSLDEAVATVDVLAPEHLSVQTSDPEPLSRRFESYGSMFVGPGSIEALADYGIGPNHTLPTGRSARFQSGLSVFTFLRTPTWLRVEDPGIVGSDAAAFGRLEGLEAHARAAEIRNGQDAASRNRSTSP